MAISYKTNVSGPTVKVYVNLYPPSRGVGRVIGYAYATEKAADESAAPGRAVCLEVDAPAVVSL